MSPPIRPFTPDDYPALAPLFTAVYPDYPGFLAETRHEDEHREPKCRCERWVVEREGAIVASGGYEQYAGMYHPRKFHVVILVHPEVRRQGLGTALYDHITEALAPFDPLTLLSDARDDHPDGVRFLERRGYVETMREWESHLAVADFDPAPYAAAEAEVQAGGIEIRTLRELEADPERNRKLFSLRNEVEQDVPSPEPVTEPDFDNWVKASLEAPYRLPDAYFVAVDGDEYVGLSYLNAVEDSDELETGLTGIRRAYRRRGVALALKLRAIDYARRHNHPIIKTWNASTNEPMLAINVRLGFVRKPAWISFSKVLKEE